MSKPKRGDMRIVKIRDGCFDIEKFHDPMLWFFPAWTRCRAAPSLSFPSFTTAAAAEAWMERYKNGPEVVRAYPA